MNKYFKALLCSQICRKTFLKNVLKYLDFMNFKNLKKSLKIVLKVSEVVLILFLAKIKLSIDQTLSIKKSTKKNAQIVHQISAYLINYCAHSGPKFIWMIHPSEHQLNLKFPWRGDNLCLMNIFCMHWPNVMNEWVHIGHK